MPSPQDGEGPAWTSSAEPEDTFTNIDQDKTDDDIIQVIKDVSLRMWAPDPPVSRFWPLQMTDLQCSMYSVPKTLMETLILIQLS